MSVSKKDKDHWEQRELFRPHLDSFNYLTDRNGGFDSIPEFMKPVVIYPSEFSGISDAPKVKFWITRVSLHRPEGRSDSADRRIFPTECRQRHTSYCGQLTIELARQLDDGPVFRSEISMGECPVMVRSASCHLHGMSENELVSHHEDGRELGGYFIISGNEKLIRLLINKRRNIPIAENRGFFVNKNKNFTTFGVQMRCVRPDHSGSNIRLHYLSDGKVTVGFYIRKVEYFISASLLLHAFMECTDREIFENIIRGRTDNTFVMTRAEILVKEAKQFPTNTRLKTLGYIGSMFRVILRSPVEMTDVQVGEELLLNHLFVHCENGEQKFHCLIHMIHRLYSLVSGETKADNLDALSYQEALLPGHLYLLVAKAMLQRSLESLKRFIIQELAGPTVKKEDVSGDHIRAKIRETDFINSCMQRFGIGGKMHTFLSTGNVASNVDCELPQYSGLAIMAERLNHFRFLCHFRSIHRGAFFTTMKTTAIRKLLPESWGFVCPVHTPDGTPCGLLNHLTASCQILTHPVKFDLSELTRVLVELGMIPLDSKLSLPFSYLPVLFDGLLIGHVSPSMALKFTESLRLCKVLSAKGVFPHDSNIHVPETLEIAPVFNFEDRIFPSIFLSASSARFIRPVKHLKSGSVELISPLEQTFLDIACVSDDLRKSSSHLECSPSNMLSMLASCTPFSDFNQSPRNMYQCQMAKQTMGTPYHAFPYRTDNKVYRLQTPQAPVVRNDNYDSYKFDNFGIGTNAVVAVISYTGYDMEDAMILNKSAYERGLAHASVYTSVIEDLTPQGAARSSSRRFGNRNPVTGRAVSTRLDADGLPAVGTLLQQGDPLYCVVDEASGDVKVVRHKSAEPCFVDGVSLVQPENGKFQKLTVRLRYNRNPVIGDKFSSRHGQKGVLSQLWPQVDMPFTAEGMTPDIIINPHAFPSRMTIGMLIESMAGKAACLDAKTQNATPFRFNERKLAHEKFGAELLRHGYNYLGNEPMYSGVSGEQFEADIFVGVVYYQRLRHMVSDKYQVRALGPVNNLTHQPIHGRKKGGGIRFGEMERDSLIGHGTAFLLQDRLLNCSDKHSAYVCKSCGSLLGVQSAVDEAGRRKVRCRACGTDQTCHAVNLPYVLTYMANELASVNVKVKIQVQ